MITALTGFVSSGGGAGKIILAVVTVVITGGVFKIWQAVTYETTTGYVSVLRRWGKVVWKDVEGQRLPVVRTAGTCKRLPIRDQYHVASVQDITRPLTPFAVEQRDANNRRVQFGVKIDVTLKISDESPLHVYQALYATDDFVGRTLSEVGKVLRGVLEGVPAEIDMKSMEGELFKQICETDDCQAVLLEKYGVRLVEINVVEHARTPAQVLADADAIVPAMRSQFIS